jgi:uncharacterized protein (TIGR03089 family)
MILEAGTPLLSYYDDATGERVGLPATALGGWASRTAALLTDGCGLGPGSRAAILLPPHWQTAAVLLGCWSAGIAVSFRPTATAGLPSLEPGGDEPFDAAFVARDRVASWLENVPAAQHRFVLGLDPGAAAPEGYRDWFAEVRRYPEGPQPTGILDTDAATVDGTSFGEWTRLAHGLAETLGLRRGDRVLIDAAEHEHPLKWLLAPLAAGASVVLCANLDPAAVDARVAAEGVTRVL